MRPERRRVWPGALGDRSLHGGGEVQAFRDLRANRVVLISGDRDRGQDADDRNHDHQFDKRKALLDSFMS